MTISLERRALLIVISAPSGGGKSAVLDKLLQKHPEDLAYSVSYTTRPRRGTEVDGRDYNFVDKEEFQRMIAAREFYEYAQVHGNLYGTSALAVDREIEKGRDVAMDIDVQGGLNVRARRPDAVLIFLMPPSMDILEKRLRGRASDAEDQIQIRLQNARHEMDHWNLYDYVLVNECLDDTVGAVEEIIRCERRKASRLSVLRNGEPL